MKLKRILPLLMAILTFTFTACSNDDDSKNESKNYIQLKVDGASSLTEDSKDPIKVNVSIANTLSQDATISFALENNDGDVLRLENSSVTIKAGEKTATLNVYSNNKSSLSTQKVVTVKVSNASDANMEPFGDPCTITVKPDTNIPELTEAQLKLIEGYKTNLGIDLTRMLGKISCKVEITYNDADKALWNSDQQTRTIEGTSIITLSEKATADTPVLKMVDNPMGLNDFLYETLLKETVEDVNESWYSQPYPQAVIKGIDFNKTNETFSTTLDSLVLNIADKTIAFTADRTSDYFGERTVVPFSYEFSAWNRLKQLADEGKKLEVDDGDKKTEYTVQELIEQGGSLQPEDYLFYSTIAEDGWENEPTDWVAPKSTFDFQNGTFSFIFPFDHTTSGGYTQIRVTYTMHAAQ